MKKFNDSQICGKTLKTLLAASLLMLTALFGACQSPAAPVGEAPLDEENGAEAYTIAIVQPMSHSSLDQIRDTILDELAAAGRTDILVETANANGDTTALNTILQNYRAAGIDLVVPIATSTAQSAKAVFQGADTPLVFAAVSDPVAAGLTGADCGQITGVSNHIPAAEIVRLISDFQPDYQKIGFLYTSSEPNSVSTINAARQYCEEQGIAYAETSIANLSELPTAVNSLLSNGVDALYTGNDNTIASAMPAYTDAAYRNGTPIYCGADSMVADGGLATIGVDYTQLGRQVAALVLRIIDGEQPSAIPYQTLDEYAQYLNLQAADTLGLEISAATLEQYQVLVEADGTSHFGTQE